MKLPLAQTFIGANECATDAELSPEALQGQLAELRQRLQGLDDPACDPGLKLQLDMGYLMLDLRQPDEAWQQGQGVLQRALDRHNWLRAAEACDLMYQTEGDQALRALAHGIWLAVTFPVDPEITVALLQHLIDETPANSDGAAVAAATACYAVDLRAMGEQRESLQFFSAQLLGEVARRHSQVHEKDIFDFWVERMGLDDPGKFLPRLAKVLEVVVNGGWWFERDDLRALIPDH